MVDYPHPLRSALSAAENVAKRERRAFHTYDIDLLSAVESEYADLIVQLQSAIEQVSLSDTQVRVIRSHIAHCTQRLATIRSVNTAGTLSCRLGSSTEETNVQQSTQTSTMHSPIDYPPTSYVPTHAAHLPPSSATTSEKRTTKKDTSLQVPSCVSVRAPRPGRSWAALPLCNTGAVLCGMLTRPLTDRPAGKEDRATDRMQRVLLHGPDESNILSLVHVAADAGGATVVTVDAAALPEAPAGEAERAIAVAFRLAAVADGRVLVVVRAADTMLVSERSRDMQNALDTLARECLRARGGVTCVGIMSAVGEMNPIQLQKTWTVRYYVEKGGQAKEIDK